VDEVGHAQGRGPRRRPHRQLVAEAPGRGAVGPVEPQVLAREGGGHHVELFEGDEAVEFARARELADGVDDQFGPGVVGEEDEVVNGLARPALAGGALARDEPDARALPLALAQEFLALEVAGDADDIQGGRRRLHTLCGCPFASRVGWLAGRVYNARRRLSHLSHLSRGGKEKRPPLAGQPLACRWGDRQ
jgi:hypothetical protein